ncbi:conserved Plasmodium protein, unknown function [Plasmodium relictum]|uniref:RAP domain-containing protein n=1 Tax=Plasmodium relictum TaxID=85471 RepID=A0A1J1H529_PLARL|nr:conserved Plasmodium protein, unknown function [Plasmodium relictum]CRH00014.1 conserved Plasmodium protein, unknown function [Plasmodium relictum]
MLLLYRNNILKNWLKLNNRILIYNKYLENVNICRVIKKNYGISNQIKKCCSNEEIIKHIKNEYDINSDLIDLNIKKTNEKNIYEISNRWSNFFKCEKSLYNVINKYLKTNKMDSYLHNYLKFMNNEELNRAEDCKNKNIYETEEEIKNILIYIMTFYYKNVRDFNIISLLSENLTKLLKKLNSDYKNKHLIFTIFEVYNYIKAMNDELFSILFDLLNNYYITSRMENINDDELLLILKTLYNQKYKNHLLVNTIIDYIKNSSNLNSDVIVNSFFYLSLLSRMDVSLINKIHTHMFYVDNKKKISQCNKEKRIEQIEEKFLNQLESENGVETNNKKKITNSLIENIQNKNLKNQNEEVLEIDINNVDSVDDIKLKINLSALCCSKLLYAYFALGEDYINWFIIHKLLIILCKKLSDESILKKEKKMHEMLCVIRSYLRYNKRNFYNVLPKDIKKKLKEVYIMDIKEKKINERNFVEKLSWHLKKLRIPHIKNVYKGGIIFDILEKDKKLVWLCFSYHHYYVKTIDLTIEKLLHINIIKSMNYKIAKIHYYQFSRMKARKTRFEYIRMCRYYALRDRRNFDDEIEGWNLPYINWYHKKNKNVHISNYFYNYKPVSEMDY